MPFIITINWHTLFNKIIPKPCLPTGTRRRTFAGGTQHNIYAACLLQHGEEYITVIKDSWKHCQENKELEMYGWCIIPARL